MWLVLVVFFRGLSTPPVVRRIRLGIEIVLNVPDSTSKRDAIVYCEVSYTSSGINCPDKLTAFGNTG